MWLRFAKNYIDTIDYDEKIHNIIDEEIKKTLDERTLKEINSLHTRRRSFELMRRDENTTQEYIDKIISMWEETKKEINGACSYIEGTLLWKFLGIEKKIKEEFKNIENFPNIRLYFSTRSKLDGLYNSDKNIISINVYFCVAGDHGETIGTLAHELVHWKQYFYNPYGYRKEHDRVTKYTWPENETFNDVVYQNDPKERQAFISNIINELLNVRDQWEHYKSGNKFDELLEFSDTWRTIKPLLYRENLLSMKVAIYKQLMKYI